MKNLQVKLLHYSPLWLASNAIRMSHDNHDKSDTYTCHRDMYGGVIGSSNGINFSEDINEVIVGEKDKELIYRIGNKFKHKSVLEQLVYIFDIDGISRALLQELARHRTARLTVKSTRYTLKELKEENPFTEYTDMNYQEYTETGRERAEKYLVMTDEERVNRYSILALDNLRDLIVEGISNDKVKYAIPEAYRTRLQWQIDGRNLQSFLDLRTSKDALEEIRKLAYKIFESLPEEHKYLYEEFLYKENN
jgi:thymidylate synthase (FAD)